MNNTKARHNAIAWIAGEVLTESGVDVTGEVDILPLAKTVSSCTGCHISTAKRHVAKAVRLARGELVDVGEWGGKRPGAAPPKGE